MQPCICETISVRSFAREDKIRKLTFLVISFQPLTRISLSLFFLLSSIIFPLLFLLSLLPQKKLSPNLSESRETCMRLRSLMVGSPCISRCYVLCQKASFSKDIGFHCGYRVPAIPYSSFHLVVNLISLFLLSRQ